MMVQRLNADQVRQVIRDLVPQGLLKYRVPEPATEQSLADFSVRMASLDCGRCFGWFDRNMTPRGFLVGVIMPNPVSGVKYGVECLWWTSPRWRGRPSIELMNAFEKDCRANGCARVTFGFSQYAEPEKMQRFYNRMGFRAHAAEVYKDL